MSSSRQISRCGVVAFVAGSCDRDSSSIASRTRYSPSIHLPYSRCTDRSKPASRRPSGRSLNPDPIGCRSPKTYHRSTPNHTPTRLGSVNERRSRGRSGVQYPHGESALVIPWLEPWTITRPRSTKMPFSRQSCRRPSRPRAGRQSAVVVNRSSLRSWSMSIIHLRVETLIRYRYRQRTTVPNIIVRLPMTR